MNGSKILIRPLMLLAFAVLWGCTEDNNPLPPAGNEGPFTVSIDGLPDSLYAGYGSARDLAFTVTVRNEDGSAAVGATLNLSVNASASVTPTAPVLGTTGSTEATLRVTMPRGDGSATVTAEVSGWVATREILLTGFEWPAAIVVETDDSFTVNGFEDHVVTFTLTVLDSLRRGVEGLIPIVSIESVFDSSASFGSIRSPSATNSDGISQVEFHTLGGEGRVFFKFALPAEFTREGGGEEISVRIMIVIHHRSAVVGRMTARALPNFLRISPDSVGASTITATLTDLENNALPNYVVNFRTDIGSISMVTPTDSNGTATALFQILPRTDFLNPDDVSEIANIVASLPGTGLESAAPVTVERFSTEIGTLTLTADRHVIPVDGGVTRVTLRALLKNADNEVMAGQEIHFSSNYGSVASPVITDSSGVATSHFSYTDIGLPPPVDEFGNPEPVIIWARFPPMGLKDFVEIMIEPRSPISSINLQAGAVTLQAGQGDSTSVVAVAYQSNGNRAPDGTPVTFFTNIGLLSPDQVNVTGGSGRAETFYTPPQITGTANLTAYVVNADNDTVFSNIVSIVIRPGPPSQIDFDVEAVYDDDDELLHWLFTITVTDELGNPVDPGTLVSISTTLGTFTPANAITDSLGRAVFRLYPGSESGFADVIISVQGPDGIITARTTLEFPSRAPGSIELSADPNEIVVRGTGGNERESATISAIVRDPSGNLVGAAIVVVFEIISAADPPAGPSFANGTHVDSAICVNGIARVVILAGELTGSVLIRATTWRDPLTRTQPISVLLSTLQITGGTPASLEIDIGNDPEDAGGGSWVLRGLVRAYDVNRNPAGGYGAVTLSVDPDIATVDQPVPDGHGIYRFNLLYNSNNTFDTLTVTASVETVEGVVTGGVTLVLPLVGGELDLYVSPANFRFAEEDDTASFRCWTILTDGHNIRIDGAPVLLTSNRGQFYTRDAEADFRAYEPGDVAEGESVHLRGVEDDFFNDPFTEEVAVEINAVVIGYDDVVARPVFITVTR